MIEPLPSPLPVEATLNKLPEVTWDRFAGDEQENVSVFGWLPRDDGRSDFVLVMIDKDGPWLISTSSAIHSSDFSTRLGMGANNHRPCRRVEDHFPGVRSVNLTNQNRGGEMSASMQSHKPEKPADAGAWRYTLPGQEPIECTISWDERGFAAIYIDGRRQLPVRMIEDAIWERIT